jgi:hypothetical protein
VLAGAIFPLFGMRFTHLLVSIFLVGSGSRCHVAYAPHLWQMRLTGVDARLCSGNRNDIDAKGALQDVAQRPHQSRQVDDKSFYN